MIPDFQVSIAASVIAAVWCLKSVDYLMFPFYKNDLKAYRTINTLDGTGKFSLQ